MNATKINQLLNGRPNGTVLLSAWLIGQGYSADLQQRYKRNGWLNSIGAGALVRSGDQVGYEGAIYALQEQQGLTVHPGGRTALSLLGKAHYLELATTKVVVFGSRGESLPAWFKKHDWGVSVAYHRSAFLPADLGMVDVPVQSFSIKASAPARAMMECLYLAPKRQDLLECYDLMEGLNNLRPPQVQELLESCRSVKVKRLFAFMAKKAGHAWFDALDFKKIDFGSGKRSVVKNGVFDPCYQITVPKELMSDVSVGL